MTATGAVEELVNLEDNQYLMSRDERGVLPIHLAAWHGQKEVLALVLEIIPAAVRATDCLRRTPLHYAAICGQEAREQIWTFLVEKGAVVSSKDKLGKTAEEYIGKDFTKIRRKNGYRRKKLRAGFH